MQNKRKCYSVSVYYSVTDEPYQEKLVAKNKNMAILLMGMHIRYATELSSEYITKIKVKRNKK